LSLFSFHNFHFILKIFIAIAFIIDSVLITVLFPIVLVSICAASSCICRLFACSFLIIKLLLLLVVLIIVLLLLCCGKLIIVGIMVITTAILHIEGQNVREVLSLGVSEFQLLTDLICFLKRLETN
jgi:uncharacterized RDD family membrane protein YckC